MKVSVIIANHKFDKLFKETINSLLKVRNLELFEVIVVSNGMSLKMASKVRSWLINKQVRLLQLQEGNPSKARNLGARVAKGKYLVFLDNDTRVEKGCLDEVIKYLDKHPKVGAGQLKLLRTKTHMKVTSLMVEKYDSAGERVTKDGFLVERAREARDKGQFDKDDLIFSGKGAGLVIRRDVFEKIGGFDEAYIYYWEEPDLMWRVWKAGYEVRFLWMGTIYHAFGTKLKPVSKVPAVDQVYLACRNQVMTILKNGVGRQRRRMITRVGLSWLGLQAMFLLKGQWAHNRAIERAFIWLLINRGKVKRKRDWVRENLPSDDRWMKKVLVERDYRWYLGKAKAYIFGRPF